MGFGCLTCLQVIDSIADAFYLEFASGPGSIPLRDKLLDYIPNLIIGFNTASVCRKCVNAINAAYDFKQTALQSRSKILACLKEAPNTDLTVEDIAKWYKLHNPSKPSDYDVVTKPNIKKAPYQELPSKEPIELPPNAKNPRISRWGLDPQHNDRFKDANKPAIRWEPASKDHDKDTNAPLAVRWEPVRNDSFKYNDDLPLWEPVNKDHLKDFKYIDDLPLWEPVNKDHVKDLDNPAMARWEKADDTTPRWEPPPLLKEDTNDEAAVFQSPVVTVLDKSQPVLKLKCRLCNYSCDENCLHAFHMILHENPRPPYSCGRCPTAVNTRESLLDHLARHTGENPYKCEICFFTTNHYRHMKTHQDTHQKPFYCSICKERFRFEKEMTEHVSFTHRNVLKCNLCKYQSKNDVLLQQHKRDHLMCRTCGGAFPSLQDIDEHCKQMGHKKRFYARY